MPASDISRLSISGAPRSTLAASIAKEIAQREVSLRIQAGHINPNDSSSVEREYKLIYSQEYYKYYANFLQHDQQAKIILLPTENPRKYYVRHAVVRFSKLNHFIHRRQNGISVGSFCYPIDHDLSPDTKEAFISAWPGPLDKTDDFLKKRRVIDYVDTLIQHESERKVKYNSSTNDDHRKVILKLLSELLHRNGSIDATGVTKLLLRHDQIEIQKDEGNKKPLDALQKYLLLGKRNEAVRFAKSKRLWDHAQCLAFLDKYQPPKTANYDRDSSRLRDDSIVQLNDEYIGSIEHDILNTVYRSLLNRILSSDPESVNIVKCPNVGNDVYEFAILSANDCEIEFDQSNEVFKLIVAIKQAAADRVSPYHHLISLGYATYDGYETSDNISYRSHLSFIQGDTYSSKTLTISTIDMLILNEIWEYCLNLAHDTTHSGNYNYICDLVPYKLIFASKLLDFGMHQMFALYLDSIKRALDSAKSRPYLKRDPFYDWDTVEASVNYLGDIWKIYCKSLESYTSHVSSPQSPYLPPAQTQAELAYQQIGEQQYASLPTAFPHQTATDHIDSPQNDYPSLPPQELIPFPPQQQHNFPPVRHNIPPPMMSYQRPIQEEITDFNPDSEVIPQQYDLENRNSYDATSYNDYSNDNSRRASTAHQNTNDGPLFSLPGMSLPERHSKPMTSSSPVNKGRESNQYTYGESFSSPFSPINQYDDLPRSDYDNRRPSIVSPVAQTSQDTSRATAGVGNVISNSSSAPNMSPKAGASSVQSPSNSSSGGPKQQQPSGDQQSGFFTNLVGSATRFLPKSNSKQMILPDDSSKAIVYDNEKGSWVDTTQPDGPDANNLNEPPPMKADMPIPPNYSFGGGAKSTRSRYPRA